MQRHTADRRAPIASGSAVDSGDDHGDVGSRARRDRRHGVSRRGREGCVGKGRACRHRAIFDDGRRRAARHHCPDAGGLAQATLIASSPATVVVTAGSATSTTVVAPPSTPTTPTPPQPPVQPPVSPAPPPTAPLTVTIFGTPGVAGTNTSFSLATQALAQAVSTSGDSSAAVTTSTGFASHVYATAGTYVVGVTVTDTLGRTASAAQGRTITGVTTTTTPPPPTGAVTVTMGCTVAAVGARTVCNLAASLSGKPHGLRASSTSKWISATAISTRTTTRR